jgi:hypothetical protein
VAIVARAAVVVDSTRGLLRQGTVLTVPAERQALGTIEVVAIVTAAAVVVGSALRLRSQRAVSARSRPR